MGRNPQEVFAGSEGAQEVVSSKGLGNDDVGAYMLSLCLS